jgi:SAM-dependent methyltransferase
MELIFDAEASLANRLRARRIADAGAGFLERRALEDLAERLGAVERSFNRAATLFCAGPGAADCLIASGKVGEVTQVETDSALVEGHGVVAARETVPFDPGALDLAVSVYALHEMNDVPGMLVQIRRALRPDGLFLGCMAGAGTLAELREALIAAETELSGGASPRVFPFADIRDAGALLQRAGFALPVTDIESVTVRYDTMFGVMRDLRAIGWGNSLAARSRRPATRRLFMRAAEIYAERFSDPDGRVRATFSTIWMSGWAPDSSQQQPLRRGSAATSLEKFLNESRSGGR